MDKRLDWHDIEVELTLLPAEESGWWSWIFPGYRAGHICLDDEEWIASYDPKGRDELLPGETGPVLVTFIYHPEDLVGRLWVGREFLLVEGRATIGRGTITALLNFDAHVEEYLRSEAQHNKDDGAKMRQGLSGPDITLGTGSVSRGKRHKG